MLAVGLVLVGAAEGKVGAVIVGRQRVSEVLAAVVPDLILLDDVGVEFWVRGE